MFRKEVYEEVSKDHPHLKMAQLASKIGEKWRALDIKTKDMYKEKYMIAKEARDNYKDFAAETEPQKTKKPRNSVQVMSGAKVTRMSATKKSPPKKLKSKAK